MISHLSLCEGEHVAIIGPNGAGKSTLIQIISEEIHPLYNPLSKRLLFDKERWEVLELRKKLGIVSASLQYLCNSTYSGWEITASGFFSSIGLDFHHKVTEEQALKTEEALRFFNAWKLKDKQMNRLSSGEARRVLLSRACVHDPQVMLLDEAVANLDFPSRHQYRQELQLLDQSGKTIILATHELSEIIPAIERIIVMKQGKIVQDGKKQDIMKEEILSEVYGTKVFIDQREGLFTAWC
ncbi:ATP-binding cassette domain-containing protein [uncultured Sphaerochaeta sp.]|uniref:ABC transporter ATP-binding protein n=1 Tax=uncultured Sphaerochaeta sp. TaxID=886478 RepID=UPI002A0A8AE9|nr:ATP-binding cassette domain-containing protein [uncultured Sphaerochaeta sp.]